VFFLDSKSGKPAAPFDTRDFVDWTHDPQLARSGLGSQGSVLEERCELHLPNGWISYGVARLRWWNAGSNKIHFFDSSKWELKWTLTLPEGAYNLAHWENLLVFYKGKEENHKRTGRLFGQLAGRPSPNWEFSLPREIADVTIRSPAPDVVGPPVISRGFTYAIGDNEIYTFGNGALIALDPRNGKPLWRYGIARDPVIVKNVVHFDFAQIIVAEDNLLLVSQGAMVKFNKVSQPKAMVVRKDFHDGPMPVVAEGLLYCFTEHP
jgi:hypothetical protein